MLPGLARLTSCGEAIGLLRKMGGVVVAFTERSFHEREKKPFPGQKTIAWRRSSSQYTYVSGLTVFVAFSTIFGVVKLFPWLLSEIGSPATYASFAGVCLVTAAFSHLVVPETRGKTLQEVEEMFAERGKAATENCRSNDDGSAAA